MTLLIAAAALLAAVAEPSPFPEFSAPRAITSGPKDHFFANYYAINAWSEDNRYAVVLETDIKDKLPDGRAATIGMVDTADGNRFIPFSTTRCWNFQEAAMAHWLPWAKDTLVFNDMREGRFCAVVMNWKTQEERVFPHPVAAVSEDGEWAVSINYARLFITRPDYGYHGNGQDPRKGVVFPEDDGLWLVNMRTGEAELIVSCAAVKDMVPAVKGDNAMSYLCHVVFSKDGKRLYFLSRSVEESFEGVKKFKGVKWQTTAFTCNVDGGGIRRCFPDGWGSSHFNWKPALSERDARTMTVTAKWQNRVYTHIEFTVGEESRARQIGGDTMNFDGHCLYTPDGGFVSGDGYWDSSFCRSWKMVRLADGRIIDLGRFFVPEIYRDVYCRCDLHPRWRPDGMQLGFNSVHEGSRQVYVMDVVKNPPSGRQAVVPARRK
ncbi:MAG: PD40 domain-containing protein [Kiritimatiellae bacterium]|nr:PD40 domain-containing protein [Kiritimatiellia bacterium]